MQPPNRAKRRSCIIHAHLAHTYTGLRPVDVTRDALRSSARRIARLMEVKEN